MSETREKLVEEIFPLVKACFLAGEANKGQYPEAQLDRGMKAIIVEIITRIGKAYAEGMKLPGEMGRIRKHGGQKPIDTDWVAPDMCYGETILIALHPGDGNL